jgi:hypothetical protein
VDECKPLPSGIVRLEVTRMVNTQWDRDDCLFIFVSPTCRFAGADTRSDFSSS